MTDEVRALLTLRGGFNIIVTIGNSLRGDDGAGPYIASMLRASQQTAVFDAGTTPENYVEKMIDLKPSYILFIDAADFGGAAGEVRRIGKDEIQDYALSTHAFPLRAIWEIIEQSIPAEVGIIGIQPLDVSFKEELSKEVRLAAEEIVDVLHLQFDLNLFCI